MTRCHFYTRMKGEFAMPSTTFFNLPQEKREMVRRAIKDEFSRAQYHEVSINKIVKAAGIARGSFYQYFTDKHDMLDYIMADYKQQLLAGIKENLKATGGDVFEVYANMLDFSMKFVTEQKTNNFCRNLFCDIRINAGLFPQQAKNRVLPELISALLPDIDLSPFDLRSKEDLPNMIEILTATFRDAIAETFLDMSHSESTRDNYLAKLELLKRGFMKNKGETTEC